jgi:hypothetical protein
MRINTLIGLIILVFLSLSNRENEKKQRPNIILLLSDDQGWGQMGYYNHPFLKTPHINEMADNGLRMNRFYAGAPVCSPTGSSVLTGRANDRSAGYFSYHRCHLSFIRRYFCSTY